MFWTLHLRGVAKKMRRLLLCISPKVYMIDSISKVLLVAYKNCIDLMYIRSLWVKNSRSCIKLSKKSKLWNTAILENLYVPLSCVWRNPKKSQVLVLWGLFIYQINWLFNDKSAELSRYWITVLYPQKSSKIWAWVNGVKLTTNVFTWKDSLKKQGYWSLIFGIET